MNRIIQEILARLGTNSQRISVIRSGGSVAIEGKVIAVAFEEGDGVRFFISVLDVAARAWVSPPLA